MSTIQTLTCANGNHEWTRPAKKGKKPTFCPKHAPVVVAQTETRTLVCAHDGHKWERSRTKGRQPAFCPDHLPESVKTKGPRILNCAFDGHEFEHAKKGKAPKYCPKHKPEKVSASDKVTESGIPNADLDNPLICAILEGPQTELQRKVAYVVNEFRNPRPTRELGDWTLLHDTFKRYLSDAAKALKTSAPPVAAM